MIGWLKLINTHDFTGKNAINIYGILSKFCLNHFNTKTLCFWTKTFAE